MAGERSILFFIGQSYRRNHENVLAVIADLDDAQLRRRTGRATSIAFNVWHLARWADNLQGLLADMTPRLRERLGPRPELWHAERLARKWSLASDALGTVQTGMGMDDDRSATLALPAKEILVDYAKRTFASLEEVIGELREEDLSEAADLAMSRVPWLSKREQLGTVGSWLVSYLRHDGRHLGMIEALKGVQGGRGTATV